MQLLVMSEAINVSNIDILSFVKDPPLFEVCGNPDREEVQLLCRDLINAKAQPMLWGDRTLPLYVIIEGHGFALVQTDEGRELIYANKVTKDSKVLCLQTYRKSVPADQLETLRLHSLWLYGLEKQLAGYTPEQLLMMRERMKRTFLLTQMKVVYADKKGDPWE